MLARKSDFRDVNHLGRDLLNGDLGPLGLGGRLVEGLICPGEVL